MRNLVIILLSWFFLSNLVGCQLPGSALEKALADAGQQLSKKIADEGILEKFMVDADGHVQDPGLETAVTIKIGASVRAIGINGNIIARGSGTASKISVEFRDELIRELSEPNLPIERRNAIMVILEWNRDNP